MDKKIRELQLLYQFRDLWAACPQGIVCVQESPDFVFAPDSSRLGVEVTRIVRSPQPGRRPLQEQEALKQRLAATATHLYESRQLPAAHVAVQIHPSESLDKRRLSTLATKLVELAAGLDVGVDSSVRLPTPDDVGGGAQLPRQVISLTVSRLSGVTRSHWTVPTAAWTPTLTVEQIQRTIDRKSRTVRSELPENYSCWLLMAIGGPGLASNFTIAEDVSAHAFQSSFEQVFLIDTRAERLWRLDCYDGPPMGSAASLVAPAT